MIKLGSHVRDVITSFEGIVMERIEGLYEATSLKVQPSELNADGKLREFAWIEEARLELVDKDVKPRIGYVAVAGKHGAARG